MDHLFWSTVGFILGVLLGWLGATVQLARAQTENLALKRQLKMATDLIAKSIVLAEHNRIAAEVIVRGEP